MKIGFDFSGTLADDMPPVYAASQKVLSALGAAMPTFEVWKASGCANMAEFLARFRVPAALPDFSRHMRAAWAENSQAGIAPPVAYEGITELLRQLRAAGHTLFLVSCCWQDVLNGEVRALGWESLFSRVIGDLDGKRATIASLGLDIYVGDTLGDMRACEGLTRFLAVGYGYGPREQFAAVGLAEVAANPQELAAALADVIAQE
jgi:phosphoglycolate phosphatase-like HAD superfamily hydrolase